MKVSEYRMLQLELLGILPPKKLIKRMVDAGVLEED